MNLRHSARYPVLLATLMVSLPLALAGCGNKGPLVMAETPAGTGEAATPEGRVPVEIATPQTLPADAAVDPTQADQLDGTAVPIDPAAAAPMIDPLIPIDPATVPDDSDVDSGEDTPPVTGAADDGNG